MRPSTQAFRHRESRWAWVHPDAEAARYLRGFTDLIRSSNDGTPGEADGETDGPPPPYLTTPREQISFLLTKYEVDGEYWGGPARLIRGSGPPVPVRPTAMTVGQVTRRATVAPG